MKKKNVMMIAMMFSVFTTATALTAGAQEIQAGTEETRAAQEMQSGSGEAEKAGTYVLPVKELTKKSVDENPYMAKGDTNIHHDCYNTDTTDAVLPLGIYPEINVSYEKVNANASPAIFFDSRGHAVVPLQGGLAIRDINADETQTLGYFSPAQHDGGGYMIQSSYSFVDESDRLVCPTSNNHVLMLRTMDEDGNDFRNLKRCWILILRRQQRKSLGKHWIRTCCP